MNTFPESYDEVAVLRHYGATDEEADRLTAEREKLTLEERLHMDLAARGHYGRSLDDVRARWHGQDDKPRRAADTSTGTAPAEPEGSDDIPADADPNQVPNGTMADVLNWTGADSERARRAIEVEQAQDEPRSSLITRLQKIKRG